MAIDVPIRIHRGADDPAVIWAFENADGSPANLAGSVFALVIEWLAVPARGPLPAIEAGAIRHTSELSAAGALVVDALAGTVTWPITIAESLTIPRGGGARYELFRVAGGRTRPWAGGTVAVEGFLP